MSFLGGYGQQNGYVYILDRRTPDPVDSVPPSDIIGAVEVQNGEVIGYEGSGRYEPVGRNGLMQLEPWLEERFTEELFKPCITHVALRCVGEAVIFLTFAGTNPSMGGVRGVVKRRRSQ
jgi:hypothetical protein